MPWIVNKEGQRIDQFGSDAEAVRWWTDHGRPGDRLEDTGELLDDVAEALELTRKER